MNRLGIACIAAVSVSATLGCAKRAPKAASCSLMRILSFSFAIVLLGCPRPAAVPASEGPRILAEIQRNGPDAIARRMDRDDAFGQRMLDSISTGDSTWLQVAAALRPTGNAGVGESLAVSVAEALPRAPEQVLLLIKRAQFATAEVCNIPFIEPPDSLVAAYYARTIDALSRVTRTDLRAERDQCRATLEGVHGDRAPAR